MNRNTRRARAIAIAQAKPDTRLVALRYFVLAASASAAMIALLVERFL
ncbi:MULTISPECIES: hypothetical protein [unclassified Rhizobium]|jgi:hypothetical protein|nr:MULTISPECIES: hypothetical protein [unclassified Rhizobium]MDM9618950.1 hypothetical protein [Rhizobium sp. S96]